MLEEAYYQKADEIIEHYGKKAASLIPIMQDIQAEYRYLPGEGIQRCDLLRELLLRAEGQVCR